MKTMYTIPHKIQPAIRRLSVFLLILTLGLASSAEAFYTLPRGRAIEWKGNVGVTGDIPIRNTIYTTLSPGGGDDDTAAIQSAINNCPAGQVVKLNPGAFKISQITVKSNITLRGSGSGITVLKGTNADVTYLLAIYGSGRYDLSDSKAHDLSGGYTQGSRTISTSTAHGWNVGDIILIDQLQNPTGNPPVISTGSDGNCTWCGRTSGSRPVGQVCKITAVPTATSATVDIPLYWNYDQKSTPQGIKLNGMVTNAGVEDLSVDNTSSLSSRQSNGGTVMMYFAADSWFLRVEVNGVFKTGVRMYGVYRCTVRSCYVHKSGEYTSNKGYGLYINPWASANLVEDNIFHDLADGPIFNGAVSGNVIGYNYVSGLKSTDYPTANRGTIVGHGAHPVMNLIEGNYMVGYTGADFYWGSSSHNTYFRNRMLLESDKKSVTANLMLHENNQYYNLVGNVIGTGGVEEVYQTSTVPYTGDPPAIYMFFSAGVISTTMRAGNWDSVNKTAMWDSNIADNTLQPSLYLNARPGWWGSLPWPAIGPDLAPIDGDIPARARFEAGYAPVVPSPTNLREDSN